MRPGGRGPDGQHTPAGHLALLKVNEGQIEAAGGQEGRSQVCQLILQLGIWFTLLQEDEGQIETAGGQEGAGGQPAQLIDQLGI